MTALLIFLGFGVVIAVIWVLDERYGRTDSLDVWDERDDE